MKLITVIGLLTAIFQTALRAATLQEVAPLAYPRVLPRSEMMADGRILVLGGYDESGLPVATVEIFNPGDPSDPTTSSWTPGPAMNEARYVPTLTRLKNGKFLVTGGYNGVGATATAEIYDPTVTDPLVNPWSYAAPMLAARYTHTATLLPDGRVLVAGGYDNSWGVGSAEIYDPVANTWTSAGTMSVTDRFWHTATLIGNDRVLVAGSPTSPVCEVYNMASNTWTTVGSMAENRYCHSTVLLPSGKVMVIGGYDPSSGSTRASTEIFDPATGLWSSGGSMTAGRYFATAVNDGNGHIYVVGGYDAGSGAVGGVESYSIVPGTWNAVSGLSYYSLGAVGNLLANGSVVIAGGSVSGSASTSSIVLVLPAPPEDADFDGLTFAQEVVMGYDPSSEDTGQTGVSDASKDWDGDGFSNLFEVKKASLAAAMNSASDNSNLPVGASRLFYSRRMSATYIANSPAPKDTVLALQPNWAPAPDPIHIESEIPYPYLSGILMGLQFPKERFSESNPNYPGGVGQMRYSALIASKGQPSETQTAELEDSKWWVHVEPSLTFETTHHFLILSTTSQLGAGGAPGTVTKEWTGKAVTIEKNKHDSGSFEYLSESTYPDCVVVENQGQSLETCNAERKTEIFPVSMQDLSFGSGLLNGHPSSFRLKDDNGDYYAAVWSDPDGIGKPMAHYEKAGEFSRLKGMSEAVAFVAAATPTIAGKVNAYLGGATVKLRGTCETISGMNFPETLMEIDAIDGKLRFGPTHLSGTVGDEIKDYRDGVMFKWQVSVNGSGWIDIGTTIFRMYVIAANPKTTLRQETIFRISCEGATGGGGIREGIWGKFAGKNLKKLDGRALTYYKEWDTLVATPEELIKAGDGQCGSFQRLFLDCLALQGYAGTNSVIVISDSGIDKLVINYYTTYSPGTTKTYGVETDDGIVPVFQTQYWSNFMTPYSEYGTKTASSGSEWEYNWEKPRQFDYTSSITAQGGIIKPKSIFRQHFLVIFYPDQTVYDPAYGTKKDNFEQWRAQSLAGYVNLIGASERQEFEFVRQTRPDWRPFERYLAPYPPQ